MTAIFSFSQSDISDFLESVHLDEYLPILKAEGYSLAEDVENMIGLSKDDLRTMGVTKRGWWPLCTVICTFVCNYVATVQSTPFTESQVSLIGMLWVLSLVGDHQHRWTYVRTHIQVQMVCVCVDLTHTHTHTHTYMHTYTTHIRI